VPRRSAASRAEAIEQLVLRDLRDRACIRVNSREAGGESKLSVARWRRLVGSHGLAQDLGLRPTFLAGKAGETLGLLVVEIDARLTHTYQPV
jgi:hypothetical protein